ncbi:MAG: hypothetical protein FWB90_01710 [Fibromonadales bacterium]|nr:hypothetical protein [Fibromonadales bacterium]
MKKYVIILFLAVFFASCAPESADDNPFAPPLTGTLSISGNAEVGGTLSANTANLGGTGSISYQWTRGAVKVGSSMLYRVQSADVNSNIALTVTRSGNSGSVTSAISIFPSLSGTVRIDGIAEVGQTLSANTNSLGGKGIFSYQWKRGYTNVGTNSSTYTVLSSDEGSTISVTVTRSENTGSVTSNQTSIVPSMLSGTVSITGTAEVGQTLTANISSLNCRGTSSYQWKRSGADISGATASSYRVQSSDVNSSITVTVSCSGNSGRVTSGSTSYIVFSSLSGTVSITGTAEVDQTLTANTVYLNGSGTISYQWRRSGVNISGGTGSTYIVQSADAGSTISVAVTRSENTGSVISNPTSTVPPMLSGTVSITGIAEVGQALTANTMFLNGSGTITYQWKRGSTVIGSDSSAYIVRSADVGSTITVSVSRSGNSGSVTSSATASVVYPALTGTVSISDTARVGRTLTAITMYLYGSGTISYQWKRDGVNISGATGSTYTVQYADVGYIITVTVTRSENSGSVTSDATASVVYPLLTGTVSIAGTAEVDQTLTANTMYLYGSGTIYYQWKRGSTVIGYGSTYTVQSDDVNYAITVTVTRSENTGSVTSYATSTVLPVLTGSVYISGTAEVGQTLTANASFSGTVFYQWNLNGINISGATGSTYTVQFDDKGSTITVTVTCYGYSGSVTSFATPVVVYPSLAGTVSIVGVPEAGEELTVDITGLGGSGAISYQWMLQEYYLVVSNSSSYIVQSADAGKTITVIVTRSENSGSVTDSVEIL